MLSRRRETGEGRPEKGKWEGEKMREGEREISSTLMFSVSQLLLSSVSVLLSPILQTFYLQSI
jgi:hypothetical protein